MWLNDVLYFLRNYVEFALVELTKREPWQWFLFVFPFFVFGETPRYIIPALLAPILDRLGVGRTSPARVRAFLDSQPSVSVIVAAHNEEERIVDNIRSLLELDYPALEIVVVDDGSTDRTWELARPFADQGRIKLVRNTGAGGRGGRPFATNLGLRAAGGQFIISVDADTTFDLGTVRRILAPFADPRVGAVSGNLKVRNRDDNALTACQACEYLESITLWKTWTSMLGTLLQASGAFGAYRRDALEAVGAWDPELAEDADLSSKLRKVGFKIRFARDAVAFTDVPVGLAGLTRQRMRWAQGFIRTYYRKHLDAMDFRRFDAANFWELLIEFLMTFVMPLAAIAYVLLMLVFLPKFLPLVLVMTYVIYVVTNVFLTLSGLSLSERRGEEWGLLWYALVTPVYKAYLCWVRVYGCTMELLRRRYTDPYLPEQVWREVPRW